jgi:hypothetical protein
MTSSGCRGILLIWCVLGVNAGVLKAAGERGPRIDRKDSAAADRLSEAFAWAYAVPVLEVPWRPLAADRDKAFASMQNVQPAGAKWTGVVSHGELLRTGCDEKLEMDPANVRFLFQGVADEDRPGQGYGEIPWRLGLLEPVR